MISEATRRMNLNEKAVGLVLFCDDAPAGLPTVGDMLANSVVPIAFRRISEGGISEEATCGDHPKVPFLILVSQEVALRDGGLAIRRFRSNRRIANTPIVVYSATEEPHVLEECWRHGTNGFIVLPFDLEASQRVIDKSARFWLSRQLGIKACTPTGDYLPTADSGI